jgi:uncharacterized protein (DUF2062 family)
VVFKRRDRRSVLQFMAALIYPRGGWRRAFEYVKHRLRRLPDTPERISRGVWAGVFTSFTPFYGLHFVVALAVARLMRGNYLSALLGTFFGNPLTYVPIAAISMQTGHFLLGSRPQAGFRSSLFDKFRDATGDLWHNFMAMFTAQKADWHGLQVFYQDVFLPYLVGGIIPGIVAATVCYYFCLPLIRAYQKRRRKRLQAKLTQLERR